MGGCATVVRPRSTLTHSANKDMADNSKWRLPSLGIGSISEFWFKRNHPTNPQDLEELERRLLKGLRTVKPHATVCLKGTRTSILADVNIKINDYDGPNIIHIYGAPGSGKSSISLTAKSQLHHDSQLVTYFRFDRNETATTTPTSLWCHVAYDLACLFPSVLSHLLQLLRNKKVELDSPMDVFTSLVENVLSSITSRIDRPLVIIIDALDECGGIAGRLSPDRQMLLRTLRLWAKLPKHFKLLVTSRPEADIDRVLSLIRIPIEISSGRFITENPKLQASIDSSNDIRMFFEDRFLQIRERLPSLPADWPGSGTMNGMVDRAAGIFMWAITAANFIDEGMDPNDQLGIIMGDTSISSGMKPLYSLYSVVLKMVFGKIGSGGVEREAETLRFILGTMILAKRPLFNAEYTQLPTKKPVTHAMLDSIRDGLRSVIAPGSLRFVHKSFDDFLLSEECPLEYRISQDDTHYLLTELCLNTMIKGLRFNMCGLETSCSKNVDIPDIANKVANGVSPLLSYSCLFFADHLGLTQFDEYLMGKVREMMLDKLLFWFEAMSLLGEINRVSPSLLLILKRFHISPNVEFEEFLHDARRFVRAFGHLIAQSAPHLYISALPFAPEHSSVANHFLPRFPWILALSTGKPVNWPSCIFTSEQHRAAVSCVAFSANEEYFVTGSGDQTISIFDSETGNLISGPFECGASVYSVCFDPDGCQVWVGCSGGQVTCWDIKTGDKHLFIPPQHLNTEVWDNNCGFSGSQGIICAGKTISLWNRETGKCEQEFDWEWRVETGNRPSISPDGCCVAIITRESGTSIKVWKVVNGSKIEGPIDSHPRIKHPECISALSFSVDSKFVVSGSEDRSVLVWDTSTADTAGPLLDAGDNWVSAVAYSPNHHLLASTSSVVTIWDGLTHEILGRLEGHTSKVNDITLSCDGQRVLTASWDGTMRMWDLGRRDGVLATNANQIHTSEVLVVAFSPCGRKLASLNMGSIQGWDTNTGKCLFKSDARYEYSKLIFSPDSVHVIAYSGPGDGIRVWDANTGRLVSWVNGSMGYHVAFRSTDGVLVLCSYVGDVYTWSIENRVRQKIAQVPRIVALSPDGLTAIVSDYPRHYVWSTTTHQPLPLVLADDKYFSATWRAYSPSGRFFASSENVYQAGSTHRVWDMRTGELATCFSTNTRTRCLAFSPDDRHIAFSSDCQIWVLDASTGQLTSGPRNGHTDDISTLAFSPDGKSLASGAEDGQVRIWNVANMLADSQLSGVGTHMEDGWVKDVDGRPLFWVPKDHRTRLVWPHSVPIGESETRTEVDLSRFRYGESWNECYSGGDSTGRATD